MKPTYEELEAKCAALDAKINVINELMEVAEQVNKLAQEETEKLAHERNTLSAENAWLKATESNLVRNIINDLVDTEFQYEKVQTPATDASWLKCGLRVWSLQLTQSLR